MTSLSTVDGGHAEAALRALHEAGHGPGLFALVADHGHEVFSGSVGVADLQTSRPIYSGDRFRVGSLTKTYVAALVLLLDAQGLLSTTGAVVDWLPEYRLDPQLTIMHLLQLRSGIPDYVAALLGDPPDPGIYRRYHAPQDLIRLALSLGTPATPPGRDFHYSNTDYLLLGLVVERATGQRLDAQLWQRILDPLGLRDTELPTVDPVLRGPHPAGYTRLAAGQPYLDTTEITPSESWASGAMVSTPSDVARFLDALRDGRLLPGSHTRVMRDAHPIDDTRGYGCGIYRIGLPNGSVAYGHRGGMPGFNCLALTADTGRTLVLYQNSFDITAPLAWANPFTIAVMV